MISANLRGLKAAVLNPAENDVPDLTNQLARIGISVSVRSPSQVTDLGHVDFLVIVIAESWQSDRILEGLPPGAQPIRVAVLENETPTTLDRLAQIEADAVIVRPFRPLGLLATLVLAQSRRKQHIELKEQVQRLERKLRGFRVVEAAKEIIADRHNVPGDEAFGILRRHAMQDRVTLEQVAETIVSANRLLAQVGSSAGKSHARASSRKAKSAY
jgi:AmiR/NasT family two-component response regulator